MTSIYDSPGNVITFAAPTGGVTAGSPYLIGSIVVVATKDAAQTVAVEGVVKGVVDVPKLPSEVWTENEKVYFDSATGKFTDQAGALAIAGVAVAPFTPATVTVEETEPLGSDGMTIDNDALEIEITEYGDLSGAVVTVTIAGVEHVLTEEDSGDWEAGTSNDATATSLAAAIDALDGVSAAADAAVVTITPGTGITALLPGTGRVRLDGAAR